LFAGHGDSCEIPVSAPGVKPKWRCSATPGRFTFRLTADRRTITDFVGHFGPATCGDRKPGVSYSRIPVAPKGLFSYGSTSAGGGTYMFVTAGKKRPNMPTRLVVHGRLTGPSTATVFYEFAVPRATLTNPLVGLCVARVSGVARSR
jgi:hypothetical protein